MRKQNSVFICYRRTNIYVARAIYQHLSNNGYDVFLDVEKLDSGSFEDMLFNQIISRPHFIVILSPSTLERCHDERDMFRREIEHAIKTKRNIVPLFFGGFSFIDYEKKLPTSIQALSGYNGFAVPAEYFEEAMSRLINRFIGSKLSPSLKEPSKRTLSFENRMKEQFSKFETTTTTDLNAEEAYENGIKEFMAGNAIEAINWFDRANNLGLKHAELYLNRGAAKMLVSRNDDALEDLDRSIQLNDSMLTAYLNRGSIYFDQGQYDQAIIDYSKAIEIDPSNTNYLNNRSVFHCDHGHLEEAFRDANAALRLDPLYASAFNNRGRALMRQGHYDDAITDFNRAIELEPRVAPYYSNRGDTYHLKGKWGEAVEDYEMALQLNPNYISVISKLDQTRKFLRKEKGGKGGLSET